MCNTLLLKKLNIGCCFFVYKLVGRIIFRTFPMVLFFGSFLIVGCWKAAGSDLGNREGCAADGHCDCVAE